MEGCEVVTTNDELREYNEPAETYIDTLKHSLREDSADMTEKMIDEYLRTCNRVNH